MNKSEKIQGVESMSHVNVSCHTYESFISYMNERVTYEGVMSLMKESHHV